MDSVKDYVELIKAPWGRMFHDLLFIQLNLSQLYELKILDFGSGLGVTSNYYAKWHEVTAIEPNVEMIENSYKENKYTQIFGGIERLKEINNDTFDIIFCHNVLEYIEEKEPIIAELFRVLKPGGKLSIVKHNRVGRVFHSAVFWNDPKKALSLLEQDANDKSNYLGTQYIYENEEAADWVKKYGGEIRQIFGMRAFWALGQDNSVKYTDDWYNAILLLESQAANIDDYKKTAFFNHLIVEKSTYKYRLATADDLDRIWDKNIADNSGDNRWIEWKDLYMKLNKDSKAQTFVVLHDDMPIGKGTLLFSPECGEVAGRTNIADGVEVTNINALRIDKEHEGKGHISILVRLMEEYARKNGYKTVTIGVEARETRNLSIYLHWGYNQLIHTEVEDGELVMYYAKKWRDKDES